MRATAVFSLALAGLALALAGCSGAPQSERAPGTGTVRTSLGEELSDLQRAYAAGTISEQEYDRQREAIMTGRSG